MWLVMSLEKKVNIESAIGSVNIKCSWADGMIGALPVFDKKEDAETYTESKAKILEIREVDDER